MPNALAVELVASAARTASGTGSAVDVGIVRQVGELALYITAASGTNSRLELEIQTSEDGTTGWRTVPTDESATLVIGAGTTKREFVAAELARFVRVVWTITGTSPSYTFSVSGTANSVYARPENTGLPTKLLETVEESKVWKELLAASAEADAFLAERYQLPLASWDSVLSRNVGFIAAFRLMTSAIGFDPSGADAYFEKNFDTAMKWLKMVSCFHITPSGIVDSSPTTTTRRWAVVSGDRREV